MSFEFYRIPVSTSLFTTFLIFQLRQVIFRVFKVHEFFCLHLAYGRWASTCKVTNPTNCNVAILPVATKSLPISPQFSPYDVFLRCNYSTLATRQSRLFFTYYSRSHAFRYRRKNKSSGFYKNLELTTSLLVGVRCYLLLIDHSGNEGRIIFLSCWHEV